MQHLHHAVEFSYALAFMTGLLGSGHCLGMCGGLVSAFFMKVGGAAARSGGGPAAGGGVAATCSAKTAPFAAILAYHLARIAVYAIVGLLAALLGAALVSTGRIGLAQGLLQVVAGLLVILLGFDLLGLSPIRNAYGFAPLAWLRKQFMTATQKGPVVGSLIGGAINGLMPCSMTMAMAVKATTAPGPPEGMLLMLAFGAGTLPSMLSASVLFGKLGPRLRGALLKAAALTVIALGISTFWQGLRYFLVMWRLVG